MKHILFISISIICLPAFAFKGFTDFNYYYDSRDFNTLTINHLNKIQEDLEFFSLLNFYNFTDSEHNFEKESFYTEMNLRKHSKFSNILQYSAQYVIADGSNNDILRFGPKILIHNIEALSKDWYSYSITFHLAQFDRVEGYNWQMEHVYNFKLYKDLFYLAGFIDHNMGKNIKKIVDEHQLGYQFHPSFYLVVEYRHNGFLATKRRGLGYGLQYKSIF